jgi:hypothetical protein
LGDLDPDSVFNKHVSDLDPLNNTPAGKTEWRYEALPRIGLEHPFVRAILKAWLGTDADDAAEVEQGLSTLRNWWQHRRKGESRSAINALGTDKMRGIVDGYTRHFFTLAIGLVRSDKGTPPKSLLSKMGSKYIKKAAKSNKAKKSKKDHSEDEEEVGEIMTAMATVAKAASAVTTSIPTASTTVTPRDSFRASLSSVDSVTAAAAATVAAITAGEGLSSRSSLTIPAGIENLKRQSFSLPSGLYSGGLALEYNPTLEHLLQQRQQQATLNALDFSQFAGHQQLLSASSVLTPLERLHLAQRQRQLSLVSNSSLLGASSSALMAQLQPALGSYTPPSWLLEASRQSTLPLDDTAP